MRDLKILEDKDMTINLIANYQSGILEQLGYDLTDPSISETPMRVAKHLWDYRKRTEEDEKELYNRLKVFEEEGLDQIVIKQGIKFHSMCEHHNIPYVGSVTIAYLPQIIKPAENTKYRIVGTSKLARIVKFHAQQYTIQERLTTDIANFIHKYLQAKGVWVIVTAKHMCEEIRGIRNGSDMVTSRLLGLFQSDKDLKRETEFLLNFNH